MDIEEQQGGFVADTIFSHHAKIDVICEARAPSRSPARTYS